jgi:hypothetical protein
MRDVQSRESADMSQKPAQLAAVVPVQGHQTMELANYDPAIIQVAIFSFKSPRPLRSARAARPSGSV